ncbi:MAG: hypothetical protein ACUVUC_00680 [Thermoguttaceae bacterium]
MHARELIELAAFVTHHGPVLISSGWIVPEKGIQVYWMASRCRLDRWNRTLKGLTVERGRPNPARPESPQTRGALEEILTGEILARTWAAVATAWDRHLGTDLVGPVARSVLAAHLEARHRLLSLLVGRSGLAADEALRLDRLRRRAERWADVLIGHLAGLDGVRQFAVDPQRADDFAEQSLWQGRHPGGRALWAFVVSSLRAAFREGLSPVSPNADLNARIAAGILSLLPAELSDASPLPLSLWLIRLTQATNDAQGLIDELLEKRG